MIGDRYDRLRINHLDISDNEDIFEKAFQLLADEIFLECKSININYQFWIKLLKNKITSLKFKKNNKNPT